MFLEIFISIPSLCSYDYICCKKLLLTTFYFSQSDWMSDEAGMNEYVNIVHHCFDVYLALAILRLDSGCDFSKVIGDEEQITINPDGDAGKKKEDDEEVSEDGESFSET